MKSLRLLRLFLLAVLVFVVYGISAVNPKTVTETKSYNGNEYNIELYNNFIYTVTNKKYIFPESEITNTTHLDGENWNNYQKRVFINSNSVFFKIRDIALSVFPDSLRNTLLNNGFIMGSTFDAKSGNLVGISVAFFKKIKSLVPLEKVYEIEQKIMNAHLNAGKQKLKDPSKKYFQ